MTGSCSVTYGYNRKYQGVMNHFGSVGLKIKTRGGGLGCRRPSVRCPWSLRAKARKLGGKRTLGILVFRIAIPI